MMIDWISPFNYDFAIATIPIQIILLMFYGIRRNLPTIQSMFFWFIMIANLIMTTSDIISCEMNEIWYRFPLWIMYAINHGYFLAFLIRGWALFAYTAEASRMFNKNNSMLKIFASIPVVIGCILVISTPWTSAIYTIAEDGYHNCSLYKFIYFSTYFYIIVSLIIVLLKWSKLTRRVKTGLLSSNLILLFGILIRKQFYHMLVTSYFSILAIIIIYLTAENPDLHRESRTQLLNKNALNRIGKELWDNNVPFNLMGISINNYETSKMVYGVSKVNEALVVIAGWLKKCYPNDFVFYMRNGVFIVLSKNVNQQNEILINDWKEYYKCLQEKSSTGIATQLSMILLPYDLITNDYIVVNDLARYGINRSHQENEHDNYVFTEEMLKDAKKQKAIEQAIKRGIAENSFEVYFQPIYSVRESKVMGAEALARLNDPNLGFIPPIEFIHIAELNGDIIKIGRQIFEKVCIFLENIDAQKLGIDFINVNLSPIQCINPNLVRELSDIAAKHNIPMEIFDFEITEALIDDYEAIQVTIAGLRAMGSELSLDDFGTGAANLASLMKLPIHVVKVDMTFVRSYFTGKADFLPDLIKLFVHSKMEIVVEGIEDEHMMEKMAELGCDYEQGYYFSKPLPPEDFVNYMERRDS